MTRAIVRWSTRSPLFVVTAAVVLLAVGVWQLRDASVDVLPEFIPPTVEVQTEALGLSAEEVEQLITVPLEQDLLNGVAWLDVIRSESVPGLSSIEMIFEPGTDLLRARQVVQERMTQAHALPQVSKPPQMLQPLSSTSRVMMIRLSSETLTPIELSVLTRWTIRPRLMGAEGVANVAIWGQRERQLQVQVDPERLHDAGVTVDQVISTTGNALWVSPLTFLEASTPGTGGFIDTPNQRLGIQHLSPIKTPEDLAQVAIEDHDGSPLRLGDVATVVEDHQPLIGDAVFTDGTGLMLVIEKFPDANTLEVTEAVEDTIALMLPGLTGVEVDTTVYRPARLVEQAVDNLQWAALVAAIVLAVALAALFLNWRAALISIIAVPVSLVAAALVLHLRGTTFNSLVLAGLAIAVGVVVDDAVIGTDNVRRRFRDRPVEGAAGAETLTADVVVDATLETRDLTAYATGAILFTLIPVFFMESLAVDSFFPPVAVSYAYAVIASLIVALTLTPALSTLLLARGGAAAKEPRHVDRVRRAYAGLLARFVRNPLPSALFAGGLAVVGLVALPQVDKSLLPSFKDTDVLITWQGAPGTSLPEMNRVTALAAAELKAIPGVENVGAHVGRAIMADQVVGINASEIWVRIDPDVDYGSTADAIQSVVDGYPGLDHDVLTYPRQRIDEVTTGVTAPIAVRLYGQDFEVLRDKAAEVREMLGDIDGIVDPQVELLADEPTLQVEVDLAAAEQHEIKPGDVRRAVATLLSGIEVGSLFEDQKVFEVVVWGTPDTRQNLTSVQQLLVDTPSGDQVPLDDVADVSIAPTPSVIKHEAVRRSLDITADVSGRSVDGASEEVRDRLDAMNFPLEYHAELLGDHAAREDARGRLIGVSIAVAIGIYLLLQVAFNSWILAAMVLFTSVLALAGGVIAAWVGAGQTVSLGAAVAFLALFAIAVRQGILLVGGYQRLGEDGATPSDRVLRGSAERFWPIVVTAIATGATFLAVLVFGDRIGQEVVHPVAIVMLGGLISSTLVMLFVLPVLYARFGARQPLTAPPVGPGAAA
ncbi:MAG: efflux RND transporter permease subunit [Acidimicrobiia bacterium]